MRKRIDISLMLLAIILTVCAYGLFRVLLSGDAPDYATEISAAIFGGLLTIVITAIMLQKQSDVDMRKDRNATMLSARLDLYNSLFDELKTILTADDITKSIVAIQVLNQRLALLASKDACKSFSSFAVKFTEAARDGKLNDKEKDELLEALGEMSIHMRMDILSGEELQNFASERDEFKKIVTSNVNSLKTKMITQQGFINACTGDERVYFEQLVEFLEAEGLKFDMGTKGLSIKTNDGISILWCFPSATKRSIELLRESLPEAIREDVLAILTANGIPQESLNKKRVSFKHTDLPIVELKNILSLVKTSGDMTAS